MTEQPTAEATPAVAPPAEAPPLPAEPAPGAAPTPPTEPAPGAAPAPRRCGRCGASLAADQRYCLNCGLRLTASRVPLATIAPEAMRERAAWEARSGPPPAPRVLSPLAAAAGAALVLLAVLIGVLVGNGSDAPQVTVAGPRAPQVITVAGAGTAAPAAFRSDWPDRDGFTVQLLTLPKDSTQAGTVAQAVRDAAAQGAADVGALDADEWPSLPAGRYVVYSGVFGSRREAARGLRTLRADFPDAKVVEVARDRASRAGASGASAGSAKKQAIAGEPKKVSGAQLEDLQSESPKDFRKKEEALPDVVITGGGG